MSALLTLTAELAADAELRHTPGADPHAVLYLQLLTGNGWAMYSNLPLGPSRALPPACTQLARALRRGCRVSIDAAGLTTQTDHGAAAFRLVGVTRVEPVAEPHEQTNPPSQPAALRASLPPTAAALKPNHAPALPCPQ